MEALAFLLLFLTLSGYSYVLQPGMKKTMEDEETAETFIRGDEVDELAQKIEEEERESRLVAGLHLDEEMRGGFHENGGTIGAVNEGGNGGREEGGDIKDANPDEGKEAVRNLTPPRDPLPVRHPNVPPRLPPSSSLNPRVLPPSANPNPNPVPGSVSLLEALLTEVLQRPGHHLKQNELKVKEMDVRVKNALFKPAWKERQTTRGITTVAQPEETELGVNLAKPKVGRTKDLEETPESNENNPPAKPSTTRPPARPAAAKRTESGTKATMKKNKSPTATKTSSRVNRISRNKTMRKEKKDNKTRKPAEDEEEVTPTHFPYFMENYCPPECACYGRVVQCSDKGVEKVPYGIPYHARYVLLMNNRIDLIQLDLLRGYVSMEFLVLSNNRLTDGAVEGAFQGVPALKRLYLDRNLLRSVPTDLPASLEELRLDNNLLGAMSEAAWARCPGLLVLSLSNNSLGNGSESLHDAVLAPLCNLRTLNLDHNQLTSVPLGLPLSVKELYLKGNLIERFRPGAFDGISQLVVLDLSSNRLTNKGLLRDSLRNATHLESLNLEGNRLKQVPPHLPRSLKTLNLEGNLISSIKRASFSTLRNLEHLGLARNKILKVAPGAFRTLLALHQLDLSHNTLRQVPRQLPPALHSVALTHNRIHSVPRDAFCWGNNTVSLSGLVRVQLQHNLMDMGALDTRAFRCLRGFQVVHFY